MSKPAFLGSISNGAEKYIYEPLPAVGSNTGVDGPRPRHLSEASQGWCVSGAELNKGVAAVWRFGGVAAVAGSGGGYTTCACQCNEHSNIACHRRQQQDCPRLHARPDAQPLALRMLFFCEFW